MLNEVDENGTDMALRYQYKPDIAPQDSVMHKNMNSVRQTFLRKKNAAKRIFFRNENLKAWQTDGVA